MRETDLYPPVKAFLEAQGYAVKGEVDGCDLVAVRGDEPPVIVELKAGFSLPLVFQGITRQGLTDNVYLAVPPFSGRTTRRQDALALCRRLGLGLLAVRLDRLRWWRRCSTRLSTGRANARKGLCGCCGSSSAGSATRTRVARAGARS